MEYMIHKRTMSLGAAGNQVSQTGDAVQFERFPIYCIIVGYGINGFTNFLIPISANRVIVLKTESLRINDGMTTGTRGGLC